MRDGIVFYKSFYEAVKNLPPDQFKASVVAIMEYGLYEKEPETNGIEYTVFCMAKPQIDANNRKYENGKKGGRPKKGHMEIEKPNDIQKKPNGNQKKPTDNQIEPKEKDKDKVKDKVKENPLKGVKEKHFVPPTLENVIGYCQEKGLSLDAGRFIDFYESKGWMVGKNKMKDWKAAARNWARQDTEKPKKTSFSNFTERHNDYDALQKKLITDGINNGGMQ